MTEMVVIFDQILRFDPLGVPRGDPWGPKKIIKILKAAFWFSVKAIASSAALSLYTLLDHRRVSYIYKKYIRCPRSTNDRSQNRARFGTALTLARSSLELAT